MANLGVELLDWYEQVCQVDAEWRVREPRSLTWWPWRFRQVMTAGTPWAAGDGLDITRVSVTTPLAVDVPADAPLPLLLAAANMEATYSAIVFDPKARTFRIGTAFSFHEGNVPWLRPVMGIASALQVAVPQGMDVDGFAVTRMGTPDLAVHPTSGQREAMDDMVNIVAASRQAGTEPCPVTADIFEHAGDLIRQNGLPVRADGESLVIRLPIPSLDDIATILVMPNQHPSFGNGLFVLTTVPRPKGVDDLVLFANALNLRELTENVDQHMLGAWLQGPKEQLAHVGFITGDALQLGPDQLAIVLVNLAFNEAVRLRWYDAQWQATLARPRLS